ncbi:MAG: cytochrome c-type biogenesis protein CcmH [Deltaproteobacteria bacterium]|nr:cytochrome c-type biogenesis protein CcmH [Deltaproteobacteria bacterium]
MTKMGQTQNRSVRFPRNVLGALVGIGLVLMALPLAAQAQGVIPSVDEARVMRLADQLRCPICQGQSVKESDVFLSKQMRDQIRILIAQGKTDQEVLDDFEARYGEFILRSPKPTGMGLLAWILPVAALVGGVVWLGLVLMRAQRRSRLESPDAGGGETPDPQTEARIARDLKRFEEGL